MDEEFSKPSIEWVRTERNLYHDIELTLKEYVDYKTKKILYSYPTRNYIETPLASEELYNHYSEKPNKTSVKLTEKDYDIINKDFYADFDLILTYNIFNEGFSNANANKIIIFIGYFICWSYLLIISYSNQPISFENTMLILLITLKDLTNPFSELKDCYYEKIF